MVMFYGFKGKTKQKNHLIPIKCSCFLAIRLAILETLHVTTAFHVGEHPHFCLFIVKIPASLNLQCVLHLHTTEMSEMSEPPVFSIKNSPLGKSAKPPAFEQYSKSLSRSMKYWLVDSPLLDYEIIPNI